MKRQFEILLHFMKSRLILFIRYYRKIIMQLCINNNEIILFYNTVLPKLYCKINLTLFEVLLSKHIYDTLAKCEKYLDCFVRI